MTTSNIEQLELLTSRIAGGEASEQDWASFNTLAASAPEAWKHLAQAQRDQQSLSLAVGVALHAADHVDLPSRDAADSFLRRSRDGSHSQHWARVRAGSGWAVAAVLALAFISANVGGFGFSRPSGPNTAGLVPEGYFRVASPDDALQLYRDQGKKSGRFVAEVPVLLESHPAATGQGFEVVYVRQILEKAQVNDLFRFAQDESGNPKPVRMPLPARPGQAE